MGKSLRKYIVLAVVLAAVLIGAGLFVHRQSIEYNEILSFIELRSRYIFLAASFIILISILTAIAFYKIREKEAKLQAQAESAQKLQSEITKREQVEKALRESQGNHRILLENLPQKIFSKDKYLVYVSCNENFARDLNIKPEEVTGKTDYDFFPKELAEKYRADDKRIIESGKTEDIEEKYIQEGQERVVHTVKTPIKDEDGSVVGLLGIFWDITERKRAEEALQEAYEKLEDRVEERTDQLSRTNRELEREIAERRQVEKILRESEKLAAAGRLAARIAHEINNPLAGIKNSFLLIKDAVPQSHPYHKYVGRIDREISRVTRIVHQMFDLYRPGPESPREFRLREVINDILALLKVSSEEHDVNIEVDISDDSAVVTLTEALFRQVLFNVIENAIEASPSDKTVKVSAKVSSELLTVKVADQGAGISEDIRDNIFEPFFTTKSGDGMSGLGLGLSVCKGIIDAMGGSITFESQKGKGTVFNIVIPLPKERKEAKNGRVGADIAC